MFIIHFHMHYFLWSSVTSWVSPGIICIKRWWNWGLETLSELQPTPSEHNVLFFLPLRKHKELFFPSQCRSLLDFIIGANCLIGDTFTKPLSAIGYPPVCSQSIRHLALCRTNHSELECPNGLSSKSLLLDFKLLEGWAQVSFNVSSLMFHKYWLN